MRAQLKRVIVEVIEDATDVLKSTEVKPTAQGKIISRGPACELEAKEGDKVLFSGYAGARFFRDGKQYLVLAQEEVWVAL